MTRAGAGSESRRCRRDTEWSRREQRAEQVVTLDPAIEAADHPLDRLSAARPLIRRPRSHWPAFAGFAEASVDTSGNRIVRCQRPAERVTGSSQRSLSWTGG